MRIRCSIVLASVLFAGLAAEPLLAQTSSNLIENAGFELPPGPSDAHPDLWTYFSSKNENMGIARKIKRSGQQSLRLSGQGQTNGFEGATQTHAVQPDRRYTFSAYFANDRNDPMGGTARGFLVIEWRTADGADITRTLSDMCDSSLSRLRWQQYAITNATPPADAAIGIFGIHLSEGSEGAKGSLLVDDVSAVEQ